MTLNSSVTTPPKPTFKIALIPGDGIGIEVIAAGKIVLQCLAKESGRFDVKFEEFPWSSEYYKREGRYLPEGALDTIKKFDGVLFGAVGAQGNFPPFKGSRVAS